MWVGGLKTLVHKSYHLFLGGVHVRESLLAQEAVQHHPTSEAEGFSVATLPDHGTSYPAVAIPVALDWDACCIAEQVASVELVQSPGIQFTGNPNLRRVVTGPGILTLLSR